MEKLKGLIFLAVVAACVYVGYSNIPPWFHYYQFRDDLDDIARHYTYMSKTDDEIKQMVMTKAQWQDIRLKEDQVTVTRGVDSLGLSVQNRIHVYMTVCC